MEALRDLARSLTWKLLILGAALVVTIVSLPFRSSDHVDTVRAISNEGLGTHVLDKMAEQASACRRGVEAVELRLSGVRLLTSMASVYVTALASIDGKDLGTARALAARMPDVSDAHARCAAALNSIRQRRDEVIELCSAADARIAEILAGKRMVRVDAARLPPRDVAPWGKFTASERELTERLANPEHSMAAQIDQLASCMFDPNIDVTLLERRP